MTQGVENRTCHRSDPSLTASTLRHSSKFVHFNFVISGWILLKFTLFLPENYPSCVFLLRSKSSIGLRYLVQKTSNFEYLLFFYFVDLPLVTDHVKAVQTVFVSY